MIVTMLTACVLGLGSGWHSSPNCGWHSSLSCVFAAPPSTDEVPDYGLDWITIGEPGNRPANPTEAPHFFPPYWTEPGFFAGDVAHEYRLMRTEVTVEVWYEFVVAFAPYWDGTPWDSRLTGGWIHWNGFGYEIDPGSENMPITISWYNAARFCNWLHNGKVNEAWAFENGVYDMSALGLQKARDSRTHPIRHADALFWIPSFDEWTKAMYYDPNRYGPGEEGYWVMPDGGNEILVSGWPREGGETSGGMTKVSPIPVATYPHVTSPWGLLDGSGGVEEWCEDLAYLNARLTRGSWQYNDFYWGWDEMDMLDVQFADHLAGLRIASATHIPCPADCSGDGELDILDFVCLKQLFADGSPLADVNGDGVLNVLDFVAFQHAFVTGCDYLLSEGATRWASIRDMAFWRAPWPQRRPLRT